MSGALDLAVIGNGRIAALVNTQGSLVWWCFPRFDSDPVFSRLLAGDEEKGFCDVVLDRQVSSTSSYERNTAVVVTVLTAEDGASVKITDFAPRLNNFDRLLRPPQLMRIIEPVASLPRIAIRVRPAQFYGNPVKRQVAGSSHITYGEPALVRLTTDAPLCYIQKETPFALNRPLHLVFGPDEAFMGDISSTVRDFCERTTAYWREWVRRLDDFVERRLMLLYHRPLTRQCLRQLADVMVEAGVLNSERRDQEIATTIERLRERFRKRVEM